MQAPDGPDQPAAVTMAPTTWRDRPAANAAPLDDARRTGARPGRGGGGKKGTDEMGRAELSKVAAEKEVSSGRLACVPGLDPAVS